MTVVSPPLFLQQSISSKKFQSILLRLFPVDTVVALDLNSVSSQNMVLACTSPAASWDSFVLLAILL
jgi:hypothetical protein